MRGFFVVAALISLVFFTGCDNSSGFPAVPVTLTLKTGFKDLSPGTQPLLLVMPSDNLPEFLLLTQPLGLEVLSIPQSATSVDLGFENRAMTYDIRGSAQDGMTVEGRLTSSYAYICEPKNSGGHRSCRDGNDYSFKGDLKHNGEIIGTIEGDIKR